MHSQGRSFVYGDTKCLLYIGGNVFKRARACLIVLSVQMNGVVHFYRSGLTIYSLVLFLHELKLFRCRLYFVNSAEGISLRLPCQRRKKNKIHLQSYFIETTESHSIQP